MRDRAFRREQKQKRKKKAKTFVKRNHGYDKVNKEEEEFFERNADHLPTCSCWMCGNERKQWNNKTIQEKKFEEYTDSFTEDLV